MISERELWACAQQLWTTHGDRALALVAERVRNLAQAGDVAGVDTWLAISDRLDRLRDTEGLGHLRH